MSARLAIAALVALVAVSLRVVDHVRYRDSRPVLRTLGLLDDGGTERGIRRPLDEAFAPLPFAWAWCDIVAAALVASVPRGGLVPILGWTVAAAFVAGRFRFLQEVGHTALHNGLCRSRRWQWALADAGANGPLFRMDSAGRHAAHMRHHTNVNDRDLDPNVLRFVRIGLVPGISRRRFRTLLLHPLTVRGLAETITTMAGNVRANRSRPVVALRVVSVAATACLFVAIGGPRALILGYVVPLTLLYPWYSWISLLVEHRWFVACSAMGRRARECELGRPTSYPGWTGAMLRHAVLPASDHLHLAHSLYPSLRWNHLPAVDRALRAQDPAYARHASTHLLLSSGPPSSLSELEDRLVGAPAGGAGRHPRPGPPPVRHGRDRSDVGAAA